MEHFERKKAQTQRLRRSLIQMQWYLTLDGMGLDCLDVVTSQIISIYFHHQELRVLCLHTLEKCPSGRQSSQSTNPQRSLFAS